MTAAALRRCCLARPGATEGFPFGAPTSVFKVAGKIFALSALRARPLCVSVKCEPELAQQLRACYPEVIPGYHLNKRHWNTITLDGSLPDPMIRAMIEGLLRPRRRRPAASHTHSTRLGARAGGPLGGDGENRRATHAITACAPGERRRPLHDEELPAIEWPFPRRPGG